MVVLVTGSSRGIGKSIAALFAKNGYDVVINYKNDVTSALKVKEELVTYGVNVLTVKCDVSKEEEVINMMNKITSKFGELNCVINNAGISKDTLPFEKSVDDFNLILNTNLIGVYLICKHASKIMNKGSIINIASNNALNAYYPMSLDYDASKAGVISLTHNMAVALAPNIRVNAVAPGWVTTNMNENMHLDLKKEESEKILLKRFADPDEIAKVVYFLASDDASYINNSVIRVDGGLYGSC